jgi:hypothetical protein
MKANAEIGWKKAEKNGKKKQRVDAFRAGKNKVNEI